MKSSKYISYLFCIYFLSGIILPTYGLVINQADSNQILINQLNEGDNFIQNKNILNNTAPTASIDRGTLIYGTYSSPLGFDPLNFYDSRSESIAINHLEGLFSRDYSHPGESIIPRLALNMGAWNYDNTEWTIPLRDDVRWHDGTSFTAHDVKWNWDRLNYMADNHLSMHKFLWYNDDGHLILDHVEVLNNYAIKFVLNKPWMDFQFLQVFPGAFMIKPISGFEYSTIDSSDYNMIIGTGPFILDDFIPSEKTIFYANEHYYRGRPNITQLIFQVSSGIVYNAALLNEECHVIQKVLRENLALFDSDPILDYYDQKQAAINFYHLNVDNIDWAVRKAMQFAYDYQYHVRVVEKNLCIEHHSPIPDGMLGYNPAIPGLPIYDVIKARQFLIDDPTYGPLVAARIADVNNDQDWKDCATNNPLATHNFTHYGTKYFPQLMENMEHIGVKIVDNIVDPGDWGPYQESNLADLEIVVSGMVPDYGYPISQIEPLYKTGALSNYNGLANATLDMWMEDAHILSGTPLQEIIDDLVKGIVVDNAATMYYMQRFESIGWRGDKVGNLDDLFNVALEKYFYNVQLIHYNPEDEIIIQSPDNTSSWDTGESYNISWTWGGDILKVNIDLYKNGVFNTQIASNVSNTGIYSWKVTSNLDSSEIYQIKIYAASDDTIFSISDNFEIVGNPFETISGYDQVLLLCIFGGITIISMVNRRKKQ